MLELKRTPMRSTTRCTLAMIAIAFLAVEASAALSQKYTDFANGPAHWIMTRDEQARWKTLTSDAEAQAFIDLFWLRRDPTPGTAENEFKQDFENRVAAADKAFTFVGKPGSLTDRGRTVIVLGKYSARRQAGSGGGAPVSEGGTSPAPLGSSITDARKSAREVWLYDLSQVKGAGTGMLEVTFVDKLGTGDFHLEQTKRSGDYEVVFEKANLAKIAQANAGVTAQTTTTTTTKTVTQTPPPPAAGLPPLKTPALLAAIAAQKGGTSTAKKADLVTAEFVSPAGDFFVPIGVYVPRGAGLAATDVDTLFGVIEDATGTQVMSFEKPARVFISNGDLLADESVSLPTGKYTAVVGVAKAGVPVAVASHGFDVTSVAKDANGTSRLILSNNLAETPDAAPVRAPFAFGKLKVVPKGNLTFSNKDDLSYFIEVHNPTIDPTTNLPKLQVKLELSGAKLKQAIAIPLSQLSKPLEPGDYNLKVKLVDMISKQSYTLEQPFKIQ
jgi:GWxTD domain-containing protein